jgi:hypothetical protein
MTKGELIKALAGFEDDIPVLIEIDPKGETFCAGILGTVWSAVVPTGVVPGAFWRTNSKRGTAALVIRSDS